MQPAQTLKLPLLCTKLVIFSFSSLGTFPWSHCLIIRSGLKYPFLGKGTRSHIVGQTILSRYKEAQSCFRRWFEPKVINHKVGLKEEMTIRHCLACVSLTWSLPVLFPSLTLQAYQLPLM
jgi:hypothetical protein